MKNLGSRINWKLLITLSVYAVVFIASAALPALAEGGTDSTDTSGPLCKSLGLLAPRATRIALAAIAVMGALFGMWQEQQNPMTWIKKHVGTFSFCVLVIAAPTVFSTLFASTCATEFK